MEARTRALPTKTKPDWTDEVYACLGEGKTLFVGRDEKEVILSFPKMDTDQNGIGWVTFTPSEARWLSQLLLTHALGVEKEGPKRVMNEL